MLDGETGFMCDVGDVDGMSEKALLVLSDKNLPGFKSRALKRAKEFDVENILPLYEDYYNEIIDKSHKTVIR